MKDQQSKRSVTVIFGLENSFNLWMHASLNGVEIGVFRWQFKLLHLWTDDSLSSRNLIDSIVIPAGLHSIDCIQYTYFTFNETIKVNTVSIKIKNTITYQRMTHTCKSCHDSKPSTCSAQALT